MWLKLTPAKSVPEVVKKSTNQRVRFNHVLEHRVLQLRGKLKVCFQNQKCFYYTVKTLLSKLFFEFGRKKVILKVDHLLLL